MCVCVCMCVCVIIGRPTIATALIESILVTKSCTLTSVATSTSNKAFNVSELMLYF